MASSFSSDPIRAIGRRLPESVQEAISDTVLHRAYLHARIHTTSLEAVEFETEWGTIQLLVPPDSYRRVDDEQRVYEPGLTSELFEILDPDDVFYDVGAHHGYVSQLARVAGLTPSNVHSFEGNPFNHYVLERNVAEAGVDTVAEFVGTSSEMVGIDDYAEGRSSPDVVKIDVEGAEYDVFRSMQATLEDASPLVYVEIHPGYLPDHGRTVGDVQSLLDAAGYDYEIMEHRSNAYEWAAVDDLPDGDGYLLRAHAGEQV